MPDRHDVHAQPAPHGARPRARRGAREGLRGGGDRRATASTTSWWPSRPRPSSAASAAPILIFTFYHAVTPEQFSVNVSIELLAMVIVGGLGSIIGSYFGAAFILLMPGQINQPDRLAGQAAGRRHRRRGAGAHPACGLRRADHRLPAGRADGPGQDVRQRAQLPAGLAVRLRRKKQRAPVPDATVRCQRAVAAAQQRRGHLRPRRAGDQGRVDRGAPGRHGRAARRQRRRQEHDAEVDQRPAARRTRPGHARRSALPGPEHRRAGAAAPCQAGYRARARGPAGVRTSDAGREPRRRLGRARQPRRHGAQPRHGLQLFPAPARAAQRRSRATCRAASSRCWRSGAP